MIRAIRFARGLLAEKLFVNPGVLWRRGCIVIQPPSLSRIPYEGALMKPSCSKCLSKANATEMPRSRIATNEMQSVRE